MTEQNLGAFSVLIEMALETPIAVEGEEDETPSSVDGFCQSFGVTAEGYSRAVAYVEESLAQIVTENPQLSGWLVEMTITPCDPEDIEPDTPLLQSPDLPGVHFISGRALFSNEDEDVHA